MNSTIETESLLQYVLTGFKAELPQDLVKAVSNGLEVRLNSGDIRLGIKSQNDLFYLGMSIPKNLLDESQRAIVLELPTGPIFVYESVGGSEVANNLKRYGITDRGAILPQLNLAYYDDAEHLGSKNLGYLAQPPLGYDGRS